MKFFLTGFMGSGKTYFGRKWAANFGLAFYDLDVLVEKDAGMSIKEIFETKGEDFFRNSEAFLLRKLEQADSAIIACGGGTPCYHENMSWMNAQGQTIYLDATAEYIVNNLEYEDQTRPLLQGISEENKLEKVQALLATRMPYYQQAKHTIHMNADADAQFKLITDLYA